MFLVVLSRATMRSAMFRMAFLKVSKMVRHLRLVNGDLIFASLWSLKRVIKLQRASRACVVFTPRTLTSSWGKSSLILLSYFLWLAFCIYLLGLTNAPLDCRQAGIKNVVLCGFLTNCCVESSMRTAYENGYKVYTLKDCSAATSVAAHEVRHRSTDLCRSLLLAFFWTFPLYFPSVFLTHFESSCLQGRIWA